VEDKLWREHGVAQLDVEEALDDLLDTARVVDTPEHGRRLVLLGRSEHHPMLYISLRFVDPPSGTWGLITAFGCNHEYWHRQVLQGRDA
jgi:hypothetical protein